LGGVRINLRDSDILSSKFYYLQPNDVVYVQPLRVKNTRGNLNTLGVLGVVIGVASSAVFIYNSFK
jgi:polysaccharide export outer membrane protein